MDLISELKMWSCVLGGILLISCMRFSAGSPTFGREFFWPYRKGLLGFLFVVLLERYLHTGMSGWLAFPIPFIVSLLAKKAKKNAVSITSPR